MSTTYPKPGLPVIANAVVVNPISTTQPCWQSDFLTSQNDSAIILFTISALTSGQTVSMRIVAYDTLGNFYYVGAARVAQPAAVGSGVPYSYTYLLGQYLASGGSVPADGGFGMPQPGKYQIWLFATDGSGTKPFTFSMSVQDRKS